MSSESTHAAQMDGGPDVQELHGDLARKFRTVSTKVDSIWRRFTPDQRGQAMKESTGDGVVLKHSNDRTLGDLCDYIPEYNLRDMIAEPEHFLDIFKFRALTRLSNQLYEGANGNPGDRELMERTGLRFALASKEETTCFIEGEEYGNSFISRVPIDQLFPGTHQMSVNAIMIPRAIGELVLLRQQLLLQFLNHIIEEILDLGSETRNKKAPEKTIDGALVSAASNLRIEPKPLRSSLSEVLAQAVEIKATLEDNLQLLRIEPTVLNQTVKALYWSRADLVPDDRGRILPAITDRHLSAALFDALTTAVRTTATWDYIIRLLQLVDDNDKVKKGLVMQELSNTCHLEYRRAQESLKRNIAPQAHFASKNFKCITDKSSGQSRIVMKGQPADYTVSNPQLHYILRLCHSDTSPTAAVQWMQKIDDHHARHVDDRMKLSEVEMNAFGDLAIIVSFMHMASTAISMVQVSRKSGLLFTARSAELDTELNSLKTKADFGDYLVPMDNLLEPHMASNALAALNDFIIEGTGARLGSLYEDIVQDSLNDLEDMYAEAKARLEKAGKSTTYVPIPKESSPDCDARLEHRRVKEKTRPAQSSVYTIAGPSEAPPSIVAESVQQFKVKATTASVFTTLFYRAEAQGSVSWTDFESAMADVGFSVTPKGGSVFTFNPPTSMDTRPITLHRPHMSEIEGTNCSFSRVGCIGHTAGLPSHSLLLNACNHDSLGASTLVAECASRVREKSSRAMLLVRARGASCCVWEFLDERGGQSEG